MTRPRHSRRVGGLLLLFLALLPACGGGSGGPLPPDPSAPVLDALTPSNGPAGGGTTLRITGEHFDSDPGDTSVTIGGAAATSVVVTSGTELTCVSPAGAEGAVDVTLTTPGGTATLDDGYAYNPLPRVEAVDPTSGWADQTADVVVLGSGFQDDDAGANVLTFGGVPATDVVVVDDGEITATCPLLTGGGVEVRVENDNGVGTLPDGYSCFTYPLEFLAEDVRLDTGGAAGMGSAHAAPHLEYDTEVDGRSDNAAVAASGSKVYVAWREMRNGIADIHFNRSLDGGATWFADDVRINHGGVGTDSANEVVLACEGLFVAAAWTDWREGGVHLYCNASSDGGMTWRETDAQVSTSGGASQPHLVKEGGLLHIVWRQGSADVMYRRSLDDGASWDDPVRVDAFLGSSIRPRICTSGNNVYVAWADGQQILFNTSFNGGTNWSVEQRIDLAAAGLRGFVEICCDDELVYIVWQDFRDDVGDIYFRSSINAGVAWRDEILLDTDGAGTSNAGVPKIGCTGYFVFVVWRDWRVGPSADILFRRSVTSGTAWQATESRVNTSTAGGSVSTDHQIAYDGPNVYVVWSDRRNDPTSYEDIYFNSTRDGGTTWLGSDVRLNVDSTGATANLPQIACDSSHVYVVWQDSRPGLSPDLDIRATASQP